MLQLQHSLPLLRCIPSPLPSQSKSLSLRSRLVSCSSSLSISPTTAPKRLGDAAAGELSARERRQLRNERRERNAEAQGNWREEVEERLSRRRRKEKLNLDNLSKPGPRWWTVRVSRVSGQEAADRLARSLARGFPNMEFKVYFPAAREKRKLKNGSYSEKRKPLYPGCIFLHCVLNREVHDFIRECDGIGGFLGSKVGNSKWQINQPKPVAEVAMEKIFREVKEYQQNFDEAYEREPEQSFNNDMEFGSIKSKKDANHKRQSHKDSVPSGDVPLLAPGATVRILSGPFAEFTGRLKDLDHTNKKATVGFTLFGKECFVDLETEQIAAETA